MVEVAQRRGLRAHRRARRREVSAATDWTCRFLAAGLEPAREYWYRFVDEAGNTSRVGRTLTAPARDDDAPGALRVRQLPGRHAGRVNAYRRMIYEDDARPRDEQLELRAAPRRLHLRGRPVSRGQPERPQARAAPARRRALSERREDARFPPADRSRRLSHGVSQLSARSRSAGCARAFSVRARCGTTTSSRGAAIRASRFFDDAPRPAQTHEGRREPGLVRVPAGARREAGRGRSLSRRRMSTNVAARRRSMRAASGRSRTISPRSTRCASIARSGSARTST